MLLIKYLILIKMKNINKNKNFLIFILAKIKSYDILSLQKYKKQSRIMCVKCWVNRELSSGRKGNLRYIVRIPLLQLDSQID